MIKILTAIFIAVSLRSANIDNCPYDYKLSGGADTEYGYVHALSERSDGDYYRGIDLLAQSPEYRDYFLEGKWYSREARGINDQYLSVVKNISPFYMGTSLNWNDWQAPAFLTFIAFRTEVLKMEWRTNFDRNKFSLEIGKKYPIRGKIFYEPCLIIQKSDGNKFWQFKNIISWRY